MSVINQMLKDLDKRQQGHALQQLPQAAAVAQPKSTFRSILWLMLLAATLLMGMGFYWMGLQSQSAVQVGRVAEVAANTDADKAPITKTEAAEPDVTAAQQQLLESKGEDEAQTVEPVASELAASKVNQNSANEVAEPEVSSPPVSQVERAQAQAVEQQQPKVAVAEKGIEASGTMAVTEVRLSIAEQADRAIAKARAAESNGKLDEAARFYGDALSLEPARHQARRQLAALRYGQGRVTEAVQVLEAGRGLFPDEHSFSILLGRLWRELGDNPRALAALRNIPDSSTVATDKWLLEADIGRELADHPLAERAYRSLLASGSPRAQWWLGLAYAQDAQGNVAEARDNYRRALSGHELSADARSFVENRLMQLGERQ